MNEPLVVRSDGRAMNNSAHSDALAKADKAWRMRVLGMGWKEVAEQTGFDNASNAYRAVKRCFGEVPQVTRDEMRNLWRERLEHLWRQCVVDASQQRPGALVAGVRLAAMAALLDGLNEPTRVDMRVSETFEKIEMELLSHGL